MNVSYDDAADMQVLRAIVLRGRIPRQPLPLPAAGSVPEPIAVSAAEAQAVMEGATQIVLGRMRGAGHPDPQPDAINDGPAAINSGRCVDWAELVCGIIAGAVMTEWDDPQSGLLHTFVHWQGRYYDSEQLDGAADVTSLPVFHRYPGTRAGTGFVRDTADILAEYWGD